MLITVNRTDLAPAFAWVAGGLPRRPAAPILQGMQLTVKGSVLTLAVFDYGQSRTGIVAHYGTADDLFEAGSVLVDGPALKKIITGLPKGTKASPVTVELTADAEALTISVSGRTYTLPALPPADYPELPVMPPVAGVIDGDEFARSVTRVAEAASRDDTLPILTCVQFVTHHPALGVAACDRYRLAHDRMFWTCADTEAEGAEFLVRAELAKAFAAKAGKFGKVTIHHSTPDAEGQIGLVGFRDDMRELITHPMTGDYMRWQKMLRSESPVNLKANARLLAEVLRRMRPVTYKDTVDLSYAGGILTVHALADDLLTCMATESVPAEADAEPFTIRFCAYYLASMLDGINGPAVIGIAGHKARVNEYGRETMTGGMSGDPADILKRPAVTSVKAVEADTFTAMVMPIRILEAETE
jgi:DNA polymerase-3 subunit beta